MDKARAAGGPTVLRMILGRQLQALREKAGMSYDEAAAVIYSSSATVRRMEKAEGALKPTIAKVFPLRRAAEAVRYMIEDRPFGRVLMDASSRC